MSGKDLLSSHLSKHLGWDAGISDEVASVMINVTSQTDLAKIINEYIPPDSISLRDSIYKIINTRSDSHYFGANVKVNYKNKNHTTAAQQAIVTNCLRCGKVQKQTQESQECCFCHRPLTEGRGTAAREATELKNRLVQYDREAAKRTSVIDDQSDFFAIDSNAWLSDEERELLRKQQEEADRAQQEKKRSIVVTIDLLGRKVLTVDDQEDDDIGNHTGDTLYKHDHSNDIKDGTKCHEKKDSKEYSIGRQRVIACPTMAKYSSILNAEKAAHTSNPFQRKGEKNKDHKNPRSASTLPRLQHDIVELLPDDLFD